MASDPEIEAMQLISEHLSKMDRSTCARVLKWAGERYVDVPLTEFPGNAFNEFTNSLAVAAREMEGVSGLDLLRAADLIIKTKLEIEAQETAE